MKKYILVSLIIIAAVIPFFIFKETPRASAIKNPNTGLKTCQDNLEKYLKSRKDSLALEEANRLLLLDPDNLSALWAKAEVLRRSYKLKESEGLLNQILAKDPKHPPSLISLSYIRYHDNNFEAALKLLKQVLNLPKLDRENKALVYMLMGSINAKKSSQGGLFGKIAYGTHIGGYFEKAKVLAPDLSEVHLGLGTFCLLAPKIAGGDIDKAINELEWAVKLTPEFATANARLAQAYKKKGDLEKYNFYLQRTKELDPENEVLKELINDESQPGHLYKDNQVMMGTFVEVISTDKNAAGIVYAEIKRIEGLLSKYNPDSDISRLNKSGELSVSGETFYILKRAKEFWQISNGAFDVTIGPLLDLWGFKDKNYYLPKEEEIKNALAVVGFDKIIFNEINNVVKFKAIGMKIDLGAIAKGYAIDCAIDKLKKAGIKSALVNAGGQIYCLGDKFGQPWDIAIKNPRKPGVLNYLKLKDQAIATSGDYEQYFIKANKRYCHIFNPKTGYPAESGVVSVTVIAPDGLTADALSTAIFVLGKKEGEELARKFKEVEVKIYE